MNEIAKKIRKVVDGSSGQPPVGSLFYELPSPNQTHGPYYTLKEFDHAGYPSMHKLFIEIGDPTGYKAAMELLGSWKHWQVLEKSPLVGPYIKKWKEELEIKLRAEGIQQMVNFSHSEKGQQAAKWLAEGGWKPPQRGRPSKESIEREKRIHAGVNREVEEMFENVKTH
jgi:hypothetical protein